MKNIALIIALGSSLAGCATMDRLDAQYGYHGNLDHPCLGRGLDCNPAQERARILAGIEHRTVAAVGEPGSPLRASTSPEGMAIAIPN